MVDDNFYSVEYTLVQDDGAAISYKLDIDKDTLISNIEDPDNLPEWTLLDHKKCTGCPLTERVHCPIAARLARPVEMFSSYISHTPVSTTVVTPDRTYVKKVDVQDALRSLFGLIMATSGCPVTKPFKYMARYHLPFASLEETITRITSSYLMRKLLTGAPGFPLEVDLADLDKLYLTIQSLNESMAQRLKAVTQKDGAVNAITILSAYSSLIPIVIKNELKKLKFLFEY